jgi:hypothetical protein
MDLPAITIADHLLWKSGRKFANFHLWGVRQRPIGTLPGLAAAGKSSDSPESVGN